MLLHEGQCSFTKANTPSFSSPCSRISVPAALYMLPIRTFPNGTMGRTVSGRGTSSSAYRICHAMRGGRIRNSTLDPKMDGVMQLHRVSVLIAAMNSSD